MRPWFHLQETIDATQTFFLEKYVRRVFFLVRNNLPPGYGVGFFGSIVTLSKRYQQGRKQVIWVERNWICDIFALKKNRRSWDTIFFVSTNLCLHYFSLVMIIRTMVLGYGFCILFVDK